VFFIYPDFRREKPISGKKFSSYSVVLFPVRFFRFYESIVTNRLSKVNVLRRFFGFAKRFGGLF